VAMVVAMVVAMMAAMAVAQRWRCSNGGAAMAAVRGGARR